MAKTSPNDAASTAQVTVPFDRVAVLVRQLTHDVRNSLNTLDLQAALLQELITDPEVLPEVKRIRAMVTSTAKTLQAFSATFWLGEAHPVAYAADIFVEDFRTRLNSALPEGAADIAWTESLGPQEIAVDIELIFRAFSEVFKNALHFREKGRPIAAHVAVGDGRFILEVRESKSAVPSPPATWGLEPLVSTRRGGYGMGLFHARRILAVHQGTIDISFDPKAEVLTTRISLPLAAD